MVKIWERGVKTKNGDYCIYDNTWLTTSLITLNINHHFFKWDTGVTFNSFVYIQNGKVYSYKKDNYSISIILFQ